LFCGYSHLEKSYTCYGNLVNRLEIIEPWYWVRPPKHPDWRFNPEARSWEQVGEAVQRDHLCIMETPLLFRAIGRHFFSKSLAFDEWVYALEVCALTALRARYGCSWIRSVGSFPSTAALANNRMMLLIQSLTRGHVELQLRLE
jgi:hypothetical protein